MKNLKQCLSPQQYSTSDSFFNSRSPSNFSAGLSNSLVKEDNGLTIKDLKQEYNKALSYIDKLKVEQNNLKNTLKMTLDHKPETALSESTHSYNRSFSTLQTKPRIMRGDHRIKELDTENEDLKGQLDTAMVRISKLQKENKAYQDKVAQLEAQSQGSKGYLKDIKSLTHDIHVLSAKLEELEEENIMLRQENQKTHGKENQEPTQNLLRYVAYAAKIASSLPSTNFARSCYEERFPKEIDTVDQLISGEFEPALLRSYKYITDLLLNISSLPLDEASMNPTTPTPTQNTNQSYYMQGTHQTFATRDTVNTNSNMLTKNSHIYDKQPEGKKSSQRVNNNREPSVDYISEKRQPSQEAVDNSFQENLESSERAFSSLRNNQRVQDGYNSHKGNKKSDFEQFKTALQKIVNPREEQVLKSGKSQKGHARHYSTIGGSSNRPGDSYRLEQGRNHHSNMKKESSYRDAKSIGLSSYLDDDFSQSGYRLRGNESRGVKMDESSERQHGGTHKRNLTREDNQSRVKYEETEGNLETEQYQEELIRYEREPQHQQQQQQSKSKKRMKDLRGGSRGDSSYREVREILEEDRPRYEDKRQANYSVSSTHRHNGQGQGKSAVNVNEVDTRDYRDIRDNRENRDHRDNKESRDQRDNRDQRDHQENRETRENREYKEQREYREERDHSAPRDQRDNRDSRDQREQRENHREKSRDPYRDQTREYQREQSRDQHREQNRDQYKESNRDQYKESNRDQYKEQTREHQREQSRDQGQGQYREQPREQYREQQQQQRVGRSKSRNGTRDKENFDAEEEPYEQQHQQRNPKRQQQRGGNSRETSPDRKHKVNNNRAHENQDVIPEVTAETYETRISTRKFDSTKKDSFRKGTFGTEREGQYEPMTIRQQQQEEEENSTTRVEDEEQNELWDKNRQELAKMRKKLSTGSGQLNVSQLESKSKDFSTFRVSFGRTESKILKRSPSNSPSKGSPSIFEVPRRKKVDHFSSGFDIITGKNLDGCESKAGSEKLSVLSYLTSPVSNGGKWERTVRGKSTKNRVERSLSQPKDSLENDGGESAKKVVE